jgi:hypothetical protein
MPWHAAAGGYGCARFVLMFSIDLNNKEVNSAHFSVDKYCEALPDVPLDSRTTR